MKNRSKTDIIASILGAINRGWATKAKIMYGAYLSYSQLNEYLSFMETTGLIENKKEFNKKSSHPSYFIITDKGRQFLTIHDQINEIIGTMQIRQDI